MAFRTSSFSLLTGIVLLALANHAAPTHAQTNIKRLLPPNGIDLPAEQREQLAARLAEIETAAASVADNPLFADVAILTKAVKLALEFNEFYNPQDVGKANRLLDMAAERIARLKASAPAWRDASGLVVRGYTSRIDGSAQPYGLVIPEALPRDKPATLYVWLHGRGDKATDLHFITERLTKAGQITPENAIVLHPFGRQCIGFKSSGEIDVLEAMNHVQSNYLIDPNRIVLMGFSMGGAGCWHLGAHYADRFVAMSPGAGFAETAEYNRLTPDKYPPTYEQTLWGLYDVPDYARNLFNLPVVAYSGEEDKQIQAARVMERAFASHDRELTHLIGPGMGHKYHPDTLKEILKRMSTAAAQGRDRTPRKVWLQTKTLRYNRMFWVEALRLQQHWQDSRIDAQADDDAVTLTTKNVTSVRLSAYVKPGSKVVVDGQTLTAPAAPNDRNAWTLVKDADEWQWAKPRAAANNASPELAKRHLLQGPIDDAFMGPFLVVTPQGSSRHAALDKWVNMEVDHLRSRWQALFRGQMREKPADQVTEEDVRRYHLILWGDDQSNEWIARVLTKLPIQWNASQVAIAGKDYDPASHVPTLIYPNPLNPRRYAVLNSGPTFREAHDRTNSLQNPKLPDWAVLDMSQPPNDEFAGRVVEAGFFDEHWQPHGK